MEKISKFNLSLLDDNSMYNINDLITCFHYFGSGVTFDQIIQYFESVHLISKAEVDEFISKYKEEFIETRKARYGNKAKIVDAIFDGMNVDDNYNYFAEYIKTLKVKGVTYIGLINFVANNNGQKQPNQLEWEGLLAELDINFYGTLMQGADIKRVFSALFNTQDKIGEVSYIANNLETYKQSRLSDYARIAASKDELYQPGILSEYSFDEREVSTSIVMSKRQLVELYKSRELTAKKFVDSFEKEYNIK